MSELTVPAEPCALAEVQAFLDRALEAAACPMRAQNQLQIAAEEIFVNIASYAYAPGRGSAVITFLAEDGAVTVTFTDSGAPFDPTAKPDADITPDALLERTGGLGILMARRMTDSMTYVRTDGCNVLTVKKYIRAR